MEKTTISNKGTNMINWTVTIIDTMLIILSIWIYGQFVDPKYSAELPSKSFASLAALAAMALVVVSVLIPPVVHNRRLTMSKIFKRNTMMVFFTMALICVILHFVHASNVLQFCARFGSLFYVVILIVRGIERVALNHLRTIGHNSRSVLFIGSDPANLIMYNKMVDDAATGYRVVGYYSNNEIENAPEEFKKLGSFDDFKKIINGEAMLPKNIDELYCCISHSEDEALRNIISFCDNNVIHFFYVPRIFGNIQLSLRPELYEDTVVYTNHHEPLNSLSNRFIKRTMDIVVSALALLCMLPFFPIVVFMIKKQSPGPIFFSQTRTGLNGEDFMCHKFRSMHVNADADKVQATKDDPRKFPFGNFMRKANIDEFPQFYNVLKGDMSVVGPRPHMVFHTEKYSALIDKYMVRHFSKPGITGYAQVTGFRGETEELWQMEGRIKKDIWYIENWSLWLDIKIIFLTAWSIIHHDKNAY